MLLDKLIKSCKIINAKKKKKKCNITNLELHHHEYCCPFFNLKNIISKIRIYNNRIE